MGFGGVDPVLQYYEFSLSSDDASSSMSGTSTSRNWPLFKLGGKRPLKNIEGIKVLAAEIPFTWYLFNASEILVLTDRVTATVTNISIPTGNYSASEIVTYVNATYPTVTMAYNTHTLKFSVSLVSGNGVVVQTTSPKLAFLLGLIANTVYLGGTTFTFPNVSQITGANFIYVCSDAIGNLTDFYLTKSTDTSTGNSGPEMAKIQINEEPGNVIFWSDPDPEKYFDIDNLNNITEVDFYLRSNIPGLDEYLDLNGASFSLKLGIIENELTQAVSFTGLTKNDRVVKRVRVL